ncbi:hypothetical protein MXB_3911, partial [Myxobolus squamalis]
MPPIEPVSVVKLRNIPSQPLDSSKLAEKALPSSKTSSFHDFYSSSLGKRSVSKSMITQQESQDGYQREVGEIVDECPVTKSRITHIIPLRPVPVHKIENVEPQFDGLLTEPLDRLKSVTLEEINFQTHIDNQPNILADNQDQIVNQ